MAGEAAGNWYMATATARATLRALGATEIAIRICGGGEESAAVGMGLTAPVIESVELSPVLVRSGSDGSREVMVDASTLQEALGAGGDDLVETLKAARVSIGGVEFLIAEVGFDQLGGAPYIYRLKLEA